ncbi:MAG TPA: glycoside hydrolase family 2 protein [Ramlibacter sp.]|nr:glycoside hydrolase family 2 protein [Ramlibacter sp.]
MDATSPPVQRTVLRTGWQACTTDPLPHGAQPDIPKQGWRPAEEVATAASADASDCWFRLEFDAPAAAGDTRSILGFDGLATLARVWLNGDPLLDSSNMFLSHECEVGTRLRSTGNELLIRCASLDAALAQRRKRPRWRTPMVSHQQLRWLRTTLLGRTPGWSPPNPPVGPWRDVWLEQRSGTRVADWRLHATVADGCGVVQCRLDLDPAGAADAEAIILHLERGGCHFEQRLALSGAQRYEAELRVPDVELWWPHTHGEPALYTARLELRDRSGGQHALPLAPLGFRTIELDTAQGDFRLKVNGVPVFCRGALWMPFDARTLRSTPHDCRAAVAQAREAGMNMLRVAGTTVYEEDPFYQACDELGVLVWQDFMFANMDYPFDDEPFAEGAALEATQQLRRLHARPCLAVLCGNSEVEQQAAMWGAPRETWRHPFFEQTLAQVCAAHAPHTPYWPSSAHGGSIPFVADSGTTSYYGVGAYLRPQDDARRAKVKFATECLAFANVPPPSTLGRMPGGAAVRVHQPAWKARSPRDLGAGWDFDDVRDHYLRVLFDVDPQQLRSTDHDRYLALSRFVTGDVMATAFTEWRRPASACGGALVLCLRDLWAGAGWGLVDDAGVPKACYHALKRVLQPIAVLVTSEGGNGLAIHVVNEHPHEVRARLELAAWRDGEVQVANGAQELVLPARTARTLPAQDLLDYFIDLTYAYRFGPPPCDAVAVALRGAQGELLGEAFHFPAGMQALLGVDAGLQAAARMGADGTVEVTLMARRLALGVNFDVPGFQPRDEHFHLAPGREVRVVLDAIDGAAFAGTVQALNSAPVPITSGSNS